MAQESVRRSQPEQTAPAVEIAWQGHVGPSIDHIDSTDVIECQTCQFAHVVPLPTEQDLLKVYTDEYYADTKPTYLEHARDDEDWALLAHKDRLDAFGQLLEPSQRSLIDIGSGPGMFLKSASDAGWSVCGIEPSRHAAAHTRDMGLEVIEAFFNAEIAKDLEPVDVVHMNNMLEHVPNPVDLLNNASTLIKPNGLLCVTVPNDYNGFQEALRQSQGFEPWWIVPSHHLNYFTFDSLAKLTHRLGFTEERRLTSFPMELFLLMGENYVDDADLGRACHEKRKNFDLALERAGLGHVRQAFYRALSATGLGREAALIVRKPGGASA